MKIRIDLVKEKLTENVGTRSEVALQIVSGAIRIKLRQDKESNRREAIVVWIDVHHPAISIN
jgi:hypothetical protein